MQRTTVGLSIIFTLRLLVAPYAVEAQQPTKVYRIGILAGSAQALREQRNRNALQQGLHELGYTVQLWEVRGTEDFERVFAALRTERPDGLYMPGGPLIATNEQRLVDFAVTSGFPWCATAAKRSRPGHSCPTRMTLWTSPGASPPTWTRF